MKKNLDIIVKILRRQLNKLKKALIEIPFKEFNLEVFDQKVQSCCPILFDLLAKTTTSKRSKSIFF